MKASPAWSRTLGRGGSERPPASGSPVSTAGAETSKAAWVPGTRSSEPTSRAPRLQPPAFWDREAADVCRPGPRLATHCGGLGKPTRGSARAPSPEPLEGAVPMSAPAAGLGPATARGRGGHPELLGFPVGGRRLRLPRTELDGRGGDARKTAFLSHSPGARRPGVRPPRGACRQRFPGPVERENHCLSKMQLPRTLPTSVIRPRRTGLGMARSWAKMITDGGRPLQRAGLDLASVKETAAQK